MGCDCTSCIPIPTKAADLIGSWRRSRKLVLLIVCLILFLDFMLLTTIIPIMPNVLYELDHPGESLDNLTCGTDLAHKQDTWRFSDVAIRAAESYVGNACEFNKTKLATHKFNNNISSSRDRHRDIASQNLPIGLLFASKPIMQLIINPFIGLVTNRIGYTIPMFFGIAILFLSTIIYAFGKSYAVLFIARAVQGIGSSSAKVSGFGMLASVYPDDGERARAITIAFGGLGLGAIVGPPFGGVVYQFAGKEAPFLVLAGIALFVGLLQLFAFQLRVMPQDSKATSLIGLLKDPYILIAAGSLTFANMCVGMLEPSLPLWMLDTMDAPKWQQGVVFLPVTVSFLVCTIVFGVIAPKITSFRWLLALIGLLLIAVSVFVIPFAESFYSLLAPNAGWGIGFSIIDATIYPMMAYLVDLRHVRVYGSVFGISDAAVCFGFAVGPIVGGTIATTAGFKWMVWTIAFINLLYAPLMIFLRNPPSTPEKQALLMEENSMKPVNYNSNNNYQRLNDGKENDGDVNVDGTVSPSPNGVDSPTIAPAEQIKSK